MSNNEITRRSSAGVKVTDEMCRLAMIELSAHWERNTQPTMEIARSVLTAALPSHAGEDDEPVAWQYEYLKGYDGDIPLWGQPQLGLADPRSTLGDDVRNVRPLYLRPSPSVPPQGETRSKAWKAIYDKLAAEGGGTWATYMMMEIDALASQTQGEGADRDSIRIARQFADMYRSGAQGSTMDCDAAMALALSIDDILTPSTTLEPSDAEVERAAEVVWNDLYGARAGAWDNPPADSVTGIQMRATARAALIASRQPTSGDI